jgi:hypothetical protein
MLYGSIGSQCQQLSCTQINRYKQMTVIAKGRLWTNHAYYQLGVESVQSNSRKSVLMLLKGKFFFRMRMPHLRAENVTEVNIFRRCCCMVLCRNFLKLTFCSTLYCRSRERKCRMFSSGWFTGVCSLNAHVLEDSVPSSVCVRIVGV